MKHSIVALLGVGMLGGAAALPAGQLANGPQDALARNRIGSDELNPAASVHNLQARQVAGTNEQGIVPSVIDYVFGSPPVIPYPTWGMFAPVTEFNADAFAAAFLGGGGLPSSTSTTVSEASVTPAASPIPAIATAGSSTSTPAASAAISAGSRATTA
ncbi:hypothetical protein BDV09DRAFT_194291 [Aspergillus tetrazonus]